MTWSIADIQEHFKHEGKPQPGCDRCAVQPLMSLIHSIYFTGTMEAKKAIYAESDAYGEKGYVPGQGMDWSGVRDSSPDAVRAMYQVAEQYAFEGLT